MKPNELMLGDWVLWDYPKHYINNPCKITELNHYFWEVQSLNGNRTGASQSDWPMDKCFKPILITSEILKKNNFVTVKEHRKHYVGNFDLSNYTYVMSWDENYFVAIKRVRDNCWKCHIQGKCANLDGGIDSVHHLQHALKTCGIIKEIVI